MIKAPFDADGATSYAVRTTNAPPCAAHSPSSRRLAISAAAAPARPDKAGGGGNRAPLLPDGRHDRWRARRPRPAGAALHHRAHQIEELLHKLGQAIKSALVNT